MFRRVLKKILKRGQAQNPSSVPKPVPRTTSPVEEPIVEPELEVEASQLRIWVDRGKEVAFIDIREPGEIRQGVVVGCIWIPMNSVPDRLEELPKDTRLIIYCAAGARSFGVTHWLREHGFEDSWSLVGGIGAWLAEGGEWGQYTAPGDADS
jgi:rhodanese-related sulfurtransferase